MPLARIQRTFSSLPLTNVSIRDTSGQPARLYADALGRDSINDIGVARTSSTGLLDIYVDDSKTYNLEFSVNGVVLERVNGVDPQGVVETQNPSPVPGAGVAPSAILGMFGDSRVANGWATTPTAGGLNGLAEGINSWVEFLSRGTVRIPSSLNYGVSGDTTTQMVARLDAAVTAMNAAGAAGVIVIASTNDRINSIPVATTKTNLATISAAFRAVGMRVIFCNELPRGDGTFTSAALTGTSLRDHLEVARWLSSRQYTQAGEFVADTWSTMLADRTATNGYATLGDTYDGLHPSAIGAAKIAAAIITITDQIFAKSLIPNFGNADVYNADSVFACPFPNPGFSGSGAVTGTGNSGNTPTSWTAGSASPSGITTAYAISADGVGNKVTMTVSGTSPGSTNQGYYVLTNYLGSLTGAGIAEGNAYRFLWPVSWSGLANIRSITAVMLTNTGSRTAMLNQNNRSWPQTDVAAGAFISDAFVVPAGSTVAQLSLRVILAAASTLSSATIVAQSPIVWRES
jgi:lysophospholipase L1-like esterase